MTRPDVPLHGSTVILGPSQAGKTRLTARTFERWVEAHGPDDVVVLEFAPEVRRNGDILGGRLDRFVPVPEEVWHGVLEANAPRAQGKNEAESVALAADNAKRARRLFESLPPDPRAVFVNDASIPFQHESADPSVLLSYADRAGCAVLNAFDSGELGTDDPVSRRERVVVDRLRTWADHVVELDGVDS